MTEGGGPSEGRKCSDPGPGTLRRGTRRLCRARRTSECSKKRTYNKEGVETEETRGIGIVRI